MFTLHQHASAPTKVTTNTSRLAVSLAPIAVCQRQYTHVPKVPWKISEPKVTGPPLLRFSAVLPYCSTGTCKLQSYVHRGSELTTIPIEPLD